MIASEEKAVATFKTVNLDNQIRRRALNTNKNSTDEWKQHHPNLDLINLNEGNVEFFGMKLWQHLDLFHIVQDCPFYLEVHLHKTENCVDL